MNNKIKCLNGHILMHDNKGRDVCLCCGKEFWRINNMKYLMQFLTSLSINIVVILLLFRFEETASLLSYAIGGLVGVVVLSLIKTFEDK
jgi:hypothetical protein